MLYIPPEIKALIVDEIWHSRDPEPSLSALGLVWKDATASIRSRRFNDVHVSPAGLPRLLSLRRNATRPFTLIRKLTVDANCLTEAVILSAINVEALTYSPGYDLQEITSLATHTRLTSLTLSHGEHKFTTLMVLLHTIPHLTSLTLSYFCVSEFYRSAVREWPYEYGEDHWNDMFENPQDFFLDRCAPMQWEAYNFPDSDPLTNICHLSLDISRAEHLWFLDFVCSPKSPFRDIKQLSLSDTTRSFIDARVDALLKKYSSSLIEFEIREDGREASTGIPEDISPPIRLTLPAGIQHYKFFVDVEDNVQPLRPDILYDNIKSSCGTLNRVRMCIHLQAGNPKCTIISHKNGELDRVLSSLDVQRFDVQVNLHSKAGAVEQPDEYVREQVAHIYPLITEKFLEGASGQIFWAYKV